MDIKQLKYFVAIMDAKSFSRAARALFVSQSTLSKAMNALQDDLGVRLLYFSGKQMYATQYGTQLYNMAKNMIEQHEAILDALHDQPHVAKGVIRIGLPPIIGTCVCPEFLASFLQEHPGIEFIIDQHCCYDIQQLVDKNRLEIGFTVLPTISSSFETVDITVDTHVLIVGKGHRLAGCPSVCYSDLRDEKFIMLNEEYMLYNSVISKCRECDYEPNIAVRLNNWDLIVQLVRIGMGVAVMPRPIVEQFARKDVASIEIDHPDSHWHVVMISSKNQYETVAVKAFKEHVRKMVAKNSAEGRSRHDAEKSA